MPHGYRLILGNAPAGDDVAAAVSAVEVEESVDLPGAVQLTAAVNRTDAGDLTLVDHPALKPLAAVAVVVTPDGKADQCIFDGQVLSHRLHLEAAGADSTLTVWGQDATWRMNLEEKVKEWVDVTDADVAGAIFADYGVAPAPGNADDDSPAHTEDGHTLMQRGSDIQFLRALARRNGKICRVACDDAPGRRTGYFARPALDAEPAATLTPGGDARNTGPLDFEWDVMRPTRVVARQALFDDDDDPDGAGGATEDDGLPALDARRLAEFAGAPMTVLLAAPVDDAGELAARARAVLRESAWFARCEGETTLARLGTVLRAGTVVAVDGAGSLNSGKYYVWRVRHTIDAASHAMKFTLVRNAVGAAPPGGGGGLAAPAAGVV